METIDARKHRIGPADALRLARMVKRVRSVKAGKVIELDMTRRPAHEEIVSCLLGPTGKLRAPALRCGAVLLVGYDEEAYGDLLL